MALYGFLCGLTLMIILSSTGCHSQRSPGFGMACNKTRKASRDNWPWQAIVSIGNSSFCSGSLISEKWVLTTAHCVSGNSSSIDVHLGHNNQSRPNRSEVSRKVVEVRCHPGYKYWSGGDNICLLKLSAPVTSTEDIFPICLASAGSTFHSGLSGRVGVWDMWSDGEYVPGEMNVQVMGNKKCKCANPDLPENMMCTGRRYRDSCWGDEGAPLVTPSGQCWVLSGLAVDNVCRKTGFYVSVSKYHGWISKVTDGSKPCFVRFMSPGFDSDQFFMCPMAPPTGFPPFTFDDSVFGSAGSVIHFSHFISLWGLVISLYVLVG